MRGNEPSDRSYVFCMRNHPSEPKSPRNAFLPKLFQTSVKYKFVDHSSIKEHQLNTNQLRHQLGMSQMAPLPGNECQVHVIPLLSTCDFHHKLLQLNTSCVCQVDTRHWSRLVKCDTPQRGEFEINEDRMHPPRMSAPSCIVPPTEQLVIRPYLVPLLPTFHGMESENPYAHIKELKMLTNGLKRQISNFSAKENEKFYECWERYMEAINACPHHGFDTWLLGWDEPTKGEVGKMKSQLNAYNAKAGMYN
ncbi:hypothetical protein CK203_018168 [Vitis vinifera]|uniref:Retrotransposon gag domain-containing protein n=1 Tax=Vitis vinifera TaxID=29760 RepID=A0A438JPJ9_VITVI|nr:hypothetical protein CK203_018168 [Vitis vinifera]